MGDVRLQNHYSCVTDLPALVLDLIFKKLIKQDDKKSFGLTCHPFHKVLNLSHKRIRIKSCFSDDLDSCMLDKLLNRFSNLHDLSLAKCGKLTDSDLIKLQKCGSTLRCLSVASCPQITDVGLISAASYCPLLSVICLYGCSVTDSGLEILAKSCKSLIEVNLASCIYITDCGIQYISQNCRQLRALKIKGCIKIVGVGLRGCSSTLAILEANCCALDSAGVVEILSGGGVEYLNISYPNNKHTMGQGLSTIGLGYGAHIKILDLKGCNFIKDNDVISIAKGCPLLKEWDLSYCRKVGVRGWKYIGLYCQNLQILHVSGCEKLCDCGLVCLGIGCKRLSVIYIGPFFFNITSYGIHFLNLKREHVKIEKKFDFGIIFPNWRFTWPYAKCFRV